MKAIIGNGGGDEVLVIAEKCQTRYDQPMLHTVYVDKKLADTFVIDFANPSGVRSLFWTWEHPKRWNVRAK